MNFVSEPQNQTVLEEKTAFFNCTIEGTTILPKWSIEYANGTTKQYTRSRLPPYHFPLKEGILIKPVHKSLNMSRYMCFLGYIDESFKYIQINSTLGTLVVVKPIVLFKLIPRKLQIIEGEEIRNLISVQRISTIPNNLTVNITLQVNGSENECKLTGFSSFT